MTYPSDSTYAAPQIGDTGQSTSTAMHDQIYALPSTGGTGGDSTTMTSQSFAPPQTTNELIPPLTIVPDSGAPSDASAGYAAGLSGEQTGANPWDTYVMNPVTETQGATGAQLEAIGMQPEALSPEQVGAGQVSPEQVSAEQMSPEQMSPEHMLSPEQAIPQLEQALQTQFDEVVKLGTSGDLSQPEAQAQLQTALNTLLETAVKLGAAREFVQGGQGGQTSAEQIPAEQQVPAAQMPTEQQMPAEQVATGQVPAEQQVSAEQLPAEQLPAGQMPSEQQMPAEQQVPAEQPVPAEQMPQEALPTDSTASLPEGAAGQTDVAPLEQNPYEPQVSPVSPDQMQFAGQEQPAQTTGEQVVPQGSDLGQMQDQLHSQVQQLLTLAAQAQPSAANPADSGTVDNFKTALLNVVKTAHEIGAQGITQQGLTEQVPSAPGTNMG